MSDRYECWIRKAKYRKKVFRIPYKSKYSTQALKHAAEMYVRHLMFSGDHFERFMNITFIDVTVSRSGKSYYIQVDPNELSKSSAMFSYE